MFFYLLKNSTIIDINLSSQERQIKILIYGSICYIILHATLFIGGEEALLYSLKPYFWLFLILDLSINYMIYTKDNQQKINLNHKKNRLKEKSNTLNSIFDSFLKKKDHDVNDNIVNTTKSAIKKTNKRKDTVKTVRFRDYESDGSSSDSDIGTDIDIDAFKASLN